LPLPLVLVLVLPPLVLLLHHWKQRLALSFLKQHSWRSSSSRAI
jgi:hypothetical protein